MKEKLRNAGLGWCESNTEVVEKLGKMVMVKNKLHGSHLLVL